MQSESDAWPKGVGEELLRLAESFGSADEFDLINSYSFGFTSARIWWRPRGVAWDAVPEP
jgi:hypothetical protein